MCGELSTSYYFVAAHGRELINYVYLSAA